MSAIRIECSASSAIVPGAMGGLSALASAHKGGQAAHGARLPRSTGRRFSARRRFTLTGAMTLALPLLCLGCAGSGGQLEALKTQNRALTEQTQAQSLQIERLRTHSRDVEDQLRQTEESLARLENRMR